MTTYKLARGMGIRKGVRCQVSVLSLQPREKLRAGQAGREDVGVGGY